MTNEELDNARVKEAQRLFLDGSDESPTILIAARLAREGWAPPTTVDPEVGSIWKHYNGNVYEVIAIANTLNTEKYPKAVIHKNRANGTVWTRRADDWRRSYTPHVKAEKTPVAVDPDREEARNLAILFGEERGNYTPARLAFEALKRGRALAAAEAQPGMVWVKHDGGPMPTDRNEQVAVIYDDGELIAGVSHEREWSIITHYTIITQPEEN